MIFGAADFVVLNRGLCNVFVLYEKFYIIIMSFTDLLLYF